MLHIVGWRAQSEYYGMLVWGYGMFTSNIGVIRSADPFSGGAIKQFPPPSHTIWDGDLSERQKCTTVQIGEAY